MQMVPMEKKPWDPWVTYSTRSTLISAVFDRMIVYDTNYNLIPSLIKEWQWEPATNSYLLSVDRDKEFYPGRKLKASDIEFALLKSFLSDLRIANFGRIENIKGSEKLKIGGQFSQGLCSGVKVLSDGKLRIFLKKPDPLFLFQMADLMVFVAPKEDFKSDFFSFEDVPRGAGSYKVVWSDPDSSLVRLKRKKITKKNISEDRFPLTIDLFGHGTAIENDAHIASGAGINGTDGHRDYTLVSHPVPRIIQVIEFNPKNELAKDVRFRKAVSLAIDRKKLKKGYQESSPVYELIPDGYYGKTNQKFEYNPEKARKIIRDHFSQKISEDKPIMFLYHGRDGKPHKSTVVERIRSQLKEVGIFTKTKSAANTGLKSHSSEVVIGTTGRITTFVDPTSLFRDYIENDELKHNALTTSKDKALLKAVDDELLRTKKALKLKKLSGHFFKNYTVLPLYQRGDVFSYKHDVLDPVKLKDTFYSLNFDEITFRKDQ